MKSFLFRRMLLAVPTLFGIVTVVFFALRVHGGSPARAMAEKADAETIRIIEEANGWDKPVLQQYGAYLQQLSHLDFGKHYVFSKGKAVTAELRDRFPRTIELAVTALVIATVLGVVIGILAALNRGGWFDYISMAFALTGISLPVFWLAMLLLMVFSGMPPGGRLDARLIEMYDFVPRTGFMLFDTWQSGHSRLFWDAVRHLTLPALALATIPMAVIARMTRAAMLEVLQEDFIRTARAKGARPFRVTVKHALRNALPQINTCIGLQCGYLLTGAVLTESIFSWEGMGKYVLDCAVGQEYNGLQACVILFAIIFILVNLLVDVSYAFFDPRVRVS